MARFSNQATMTYNSLTVPSNIAYGEITEALSITKTAVKTVYNTSGDVIAYVITLTNTDGTDVSGVTVTDNLGAYTTAGVTYYPLTYTSGTIQYLIGGTLQPAPTVTSAQPLTVTGINIPANSTVTLAFHTTVNDFARFGTDDYIENTSTATTNTGDITAKAKIDTEDIPVLSIEKVITPTTITGGGRVTYTLRIVNSGNAEATADDEIIISDDFDPRLAGIAVTFNTTNWTGDTTKYTYDEESGEFDTVSGAVTVPAATYTVDPDTGQTVIEYGVSTLTITGTI